MNLNKRKLTTYINSCNELKFGDYILFQEYKQINHDGENYIYKITKPIMAIFLGWFEADQTLGFNYVRWNNSNHSVWITNEYVKNCRTTKMVERIENHIEWSNFIDVLGYWKNKPNWKDIILSYRKQNLDESISEDEIDWDLI